MSSPGVAAAATDPISYHYSLRVKLVKAVDLPDKGLTPNTPACPRFKLGLLPLHGRESMEDLQILLHPNGLTDNALLLSTKTNLNSNSTSDNKKSHSLTDFRTQTPITSYVSSMKTRSDGQPDADIKFSSSKILSKAHFGAMDWHEEFSWDGILAPQLTVLAVELSTLLLPAMTTASNTSNLRSSTSSTSIQNKLSNTMSMLLWGGNTTSATTATAAGSSSTYGGSAASTTTTGGASGRKYSLSSQTTHTATKVSSPSLTSISKQSTHFLDKNQLWIEEAMMNHASTPTTTNTGTAVDPLSSSSSSSISQSSTNFLDMDLRIGTLLIPLSRLPIQDDAADRCSEDTSNMVVEKWYQLQSINSLNAAASTRGKVGVNLLPSVLLAIALYKHRVVSTLPPSLSTSTSMVTSSNTPLASTTGSGTATSSTNSNINNNVSKDFPQTPCPDTSHDDDADDHSFPAFTTSPMTLHKQSLSEDDSLSSFDSNNNNNNTSPSSKNTTVSALRSRLDSTDRNRLPLDSLEKNRPRLDEFTAGSYRKRTSSAALLSPSAAMVIDHDEAYPFHLEQVSEYEEEGKEEDQEPLRKEQHHHLQQQQHIVEPTYSMVDDGPLLSPGLVDHILVVGVKNIVGALPGSNQELKKSSGWLDTIQPECCIYEHYPSLDSQHHGGDRYDFWDLIAFLFSVKRNTYIVYLFLSHKCHKKDLKMYQPWRNGFASHMVVNSGEVKTLHHMMI